jgi:hypothetical protein
MRFRTVTDKYEMISHYNRKCLDSYVFETNKTKYDKGQIKVADKVQRDPIIKPF